MELRREIPIFFIALLFSCVANAALGQGGPGKAPPPTLVEVAPVEYGPLTPGQEFVGTVMPLKKAVVGSAVDGRVIEFRVNEGDYVDLAVEGGNVLAVLLTETIGKELESAEAELRLRQEELRELKTGSRPEEKEQARARMEAARAGMEYTKLRLQRLEALFRQGRAASREEVDEATAAANQAHNAYLDAVATQELVDLGPRTEKVAQAEARVAMQQAVVDRIKDQIEKHTIRARFNGYVSAEFTEIGSWVNRGDPVAEIVHLDQVDIEVYVVENHVPYVHVGDEVSVTVPALPDAVELFPGRVELVVPQADPRTRTFPVKVRVQNKKQGSVPVLKAGMLARVWLPVGLEQKGLKVPKDSLVLEGERKSIWVIDSKTATTANEGGRTFRQGMATKVAITLGPEDEHSVLVEGAIRPGQFVVTLGNERIFNPMVRWLVPGAASKRTAQAR